MSHSAFTLCTGVSALMINMSSSNAWFLLEGCHHNWKEPEGLQEECPVAAHRYISKVK
jgi:hypothetical protein